MIMPSSGRSEPNCNSELLCKKYMLGSCIIDGGFCRMFIASKETDQFEFLIPGNLPRDIHILKDLYGKIKYKAVLF